MTRIGWINLALIAVLCGLLAACGGTSTKTEVFRPTSPLASDLYLQIRAPSGALAALASRLRRTKTLGGFIVASQAHGREDCNFSRAIPPRTRAGLRKYVGEKVTVRIYGNSRLAPSFCKGFGAAIGGGSGATAAARLQKARTCTLVDRVGVRGAKVYFEVSVTPKRFERAWCAAFRRHYGSPFTPRHLQSGKLEASHRYCALALRTSRTRAVVEIFANRYFAGAVTCSRLRTFPPAGFRLIR